MDDKITIITAPDILHNQSYSILLIQPTNDIKKQIEQFLRTNDSPINIYIYEHQTTDINWLLTVLKLTNIAIIDLDAVQENLKYFISYILSFPNVWYKQSHNLPDWSLLNKNKFFDFPQIHIKEIE